MALNSTQVWRTKALIALIAIVTIGGCASTPSEQPGGNTVHNSEVQIHLQNQSTFEGQETIILEQKIKLEADHDYSGDNDLNQIPFDSVSDNLNAEPESDLDSSNYISSDHYYTFTTHPAPEPREEVVVKSVTIRDCVARGLVHNLSDSKYARNVEVTLESRDGSRSANWNWPLTVMPGEYAPFEISIDWDPSYLHPIVNGPHRPPGHRLGSWDLVGNILSRVKADFTTDVDVSRAFAVDWDQTGSLYRYGEPQQLIIYDERLFSMNEWDEWNRSPKIYQLISDEAFEYSFPKSLILSDDMHAIASKFTVLEQSDIHYIPNIIFPDQYEQQVHLNVDNIIVIQAITKGINVLDVRQLIPFELKYKRDDPTSQFFSFISRNDFVNAEYNDSSQRYMLISVPEIYPKVNNGIYSTSVSYGADSSIWIGKPYYLSNAQIVDTLDVADEGILFTSDETPRKSCDRAGGLTKEEVRFGSSPNVSDVTLGYYGLFREFVSNEEPNDSVQIDLTSISAKDGFVRGLVHNLSTNLSARAVTIEAAQNSVPDVIGKWDWPLTLQPGERAPFEIFLGGWTGFIPSSTLKLQVEYDFSETVDITRAFQVRVYNQGTVYEEKTSSNLEFSIQPEYSFQGITTDAAFSWPHQYLSLDEYVERYSIENENAVTSPFHFVDLHAQLEIPDSHPSLGSLIASQDIDSLHSYVAIIDEDGRISDVKEPVLYTSSNVDDAGGNDVVVVKSIPTPNLMNPGSFRLLFTIPYWEEAGRDLRNTYQVWVGGGDGAVEEGQ